jgi:invasion protein IalB
LGAGRVKIIVKLGVFVSLVLLGGLSELSAQATKAKGPAPAPAQATPSPAPSPSADAAGAPPQPGWIARCGSTSRDAPLECAIEETAVLTKTGQLIVLVNIRVTSDTRSPVALVQLPLGLNLPAGARLQVDEGKPADLQIQTCENRGCYANLPVAPDLLAALRSGKQLKISFQNLAKETITIPMPLTDFAAAYDKIK